MSRRYRVLGAGLALALSIAGPAGAGGSTAPEFGSYETRFVQADPEATAIADVTGDGNDDVVMTFTGKSTDGVGPEEWKLVVYPGAGDGTLAAALPPLPTHEATAHALMPMAVGNLTGDAGIDVAVGTSSGVDVFIQAEGGLRAPFLIPTTSGVVDLLIADADGDGGSDLLIATQREILYFKNPGQGNPPVLVPGGFVVPPAPIYTGGEGVTLTQMAMGPLVGDFRGDVVATTGNSFILIEGHGEKIAPQIYETRFDVDRTYTANAARPELDIIDVDVGDVTGDGRADVVVALDGDGPAARLNVFPQKADPLEGEASLADPVVHSVPGNLLTTLEVRDIDGDEISEVFFLRSGSLEVLLSRPDGTLSNGCSRPIPEAGYHKGALGLGDLSGDGLLDAAVAGDPGSEALAWLLQNQPEAPGKSALSLAPSSGSVKVHKPVNLQGLLDLDGACPLAGQQIRIVRNGPGGSEKVLLGKTTATGAFSIQDVPEKGGLFEYRAFWTGDERRPDAASSVAHVQALADGVLIGDKIKPVVKGLMSRFSDTKGPFRIFSGRRATFTARVSDVPAGTPVRVEIQMKRGGKWRPYRTRTATIQKGRAVFKFAGKKAKSYRARTRFLGGEDWVPNKSRWAKYRFER